MDVTNMLETQVVHLLQEALNEFGVKEVKIEVPRYIAMLSRNHWLKQTLDEASKDFNGVCFVNLVDFDAKWGHRRNVKGYAEELEKFDEKLGQLLPLLKEDDLVMITADHGNDPTWTGTDHTREMVPLFLYSPSFTGSGLLRTSDTFSDIGATIADNFNVEAPEWGTSLMEYLK